MTLEGGLGTIEYPNLIWGDGKLRHSAFTDLRADATLFTEYRLADSFGVNATVRYTANFSNTQIPLGEGGPNNFDMAWTRFEAYLGVRWFM